MGNALKNNFFNFIKFTVSIVMMAITFFLFFASLLIFLLILFVATPALAQNIIELKETRNMEESEKIKKAVGWHWYNEIYLEEKKENKENKDQEQEAQKKSAVAQMAFLRQSVREAKAKAILYPTVENMRSYLILQNFVTNQALLFTKAWKQTLLTYPELDYSILHPIQNSAQHIVYAETGRKEKEAIQFFGEKYGLFFFYRGNNPLDQALAPTIESFSEEHNISLMPVSMDGKTLTVFGVSQTNRGQAEKLGVKYFPALILVDPRNQKVLPLHYGFISDSELRRRFLQVATNFQERV